MNWRRHKSLSFFQKRNLYIAPYEERINKLKGEKIMKKFKIIVESIFMGIFMPKEALKQIGELEA